MKEFTKLDKNLIFWLSELLIDNKTVTAIFTMLKTQEKRRKMFYFIRDNFNFVTESNILSFACALDNKREQRMPAYLIVKYIGETTDEITNGKLYQVGVCYDAGQIYKIKTDTIGAKRPLILHSAFRIQLRLASMPSAIAVANFC